MLDSNTVKVVSFPLNLNLAKLYAVTADKKVAVIAETEVIIVLFNNVFKNGIPIASSAYRKASLKLKNDICFGNSIRNDWKISSGLLRDNEIIHIIGIKIKISNIKSIALV